MALFLNGTPFGERRRSRFPYATRLAALMVSSLIVLLSFAPTCFGQQSGNSTAAQDANSQDSPTATQMRRLNDALLRIHGQMQDASPDRAARLRGEARRLIAQRAAALARMIQTNPRDALSFAFSPKLLADMSTKFPYSGALLERRTTISGPIEVWIEDFPGRNSSRTRVRMKTGVNNGIELHFAHQPSTLKTGDVVQVSGMMAAEALAVSETVIMPNGITTSSTTTPSCSTTGAQNVAVLLVDFPGVTPPSNITPQSVSDMFFSTTGPSLDGYWREASYGQTSARGDVFGWYTLDSSYASCARMDLLRDAAVAAATNAGVPIQNYSRIFVVTTDFGCGWAGMSLGGCTTVNSPTGSFSASTSFLDASWQGSQIQGAENAAHEGGHNLGLGHAQLRTFGTEPLGPVGAAGTLLEYGDHWSDMSSSNIGHYAMPHKAEILGWTSSANYQNVQASGTYTIAPLELPSAAPQALKVQRGTGNAGYYLWIEYREPIGNYDSTLAPAPQSGAIIHYEDPTTGGYTQLLDFTPATSTMTDAVLLPGSKWSDPYTDLSLTVVSATSTSLTVDVKYSGAQTCVSGNPSLSISPLNPSAYAGSDTAYTVTVTDKDSAGCPLATYALSSSQPAGWSSAFSSSSLTLSPGESGTFTMTQAPPLGTAPGTYPIAASAANQSFVGSATANLTVMTAPTMTVNLSESASSYTQRGTVGLTAMVMNGGSPVSGANVVFTMTFPDGSVVTQNTTTSRKGTATWSYKLSRQSPIGTYYATAQATYSNGTSATQSATSNTVTFSVH